MDNKNEETMLVIAELVPTNDEFLEKVAGVMTSGMPQKGAKYTLPESMVLTLLRDIYVQGFQKGVSLAEQAAMQAYMAGFEDAKHSVERSQ